MTLLEFGNIEDGLGVDIKKFIKFHIRFIDTDANKVITIFKVDTLDKALRLAKEKFGIASFDLLTNNTGRDILI
jgi:hypothetical protein